MIVLSKIVGPLASLIGYIMISGILATAICVLFDEAFIEVRRRTERLSERVLELEKIAFKRKRK